jgi:hypothetical protein
MRRFIQMTTIAVVVVAVLAPVASAKATLHVRKQGSDQLASPTEPAAYTYKLSNVIVSS